MKEDSIEFKEAWAKWVKQEKKRAETGYSVPGTGYWLKVRRERARRGSYFMGVAMAAVLVVALVTSVVLVRQGVIFEKKPVYTQAQIEESYEGTVKALVLCAKSIRQGMGQFKDLQKIPQSIDQIKTLKTAVSEINKENQPIEN